MLKRLLWRVLESYVAPFLWRLLAPYITAAIHGSLVGFYQQLVAAGQLQNIPAQPADPHEYPPGVRHSPLIH